MRLICPNCGAQYAVADDVIPASGRDVQCSNCAHTWFETPGASSDDLAPAPRKTVAPEKPKGPFDGNIADAFKENPDNLAPAPQAPKGRKTVDPDVAEILREEAALEAAQRRKETPAAMESQSDLGLSDPPAPPKRRDPAEAQRAAATAAASVGSVVAAKPSTARRELLPDIEDINSSLRSEKDKSAHGSDPSADAKTRRGFRRGFFLMIAIFAILVAVYLQADAIKTALPGLAPLLDSYVTTVDQWRIWLDATVRSLLTSASVDTE